MKKLSLLLSLVLLIGIAMIPVTRAEGLKPFYCTLNQAYFLSGKAAEQIPVEKAKWDKDDPKGTDFLNRGKLLCTTALEKFLNQDGFTLVVEDWGWAEPLEQKQAAAFLAKDGPNLFIGETQQPGYVRQGYYLPFPPALAAKMKREIAPAAWNPMVYKGKIYGFADAPGVNSLFWNKALFKKAGLNPDKGPKTWAEFLSMSEKITKAGKGQYYGGSMYMGPNFGGSLRYTGFALMAGGGYVDDNSMPTFDTKANIKAFEYLRKLSKQCPPGLAAGPSEGPYWDALMQQRIAFAVDGPWRTSAGEQAGIDFGVGPLPLPKSTTKAANVTIGACFIAVPVFAKEKEEAFRVLDYLSSKEYQSIIAKIPARPPVYKAVAESPEYKKANPALYASYKSMAGNVQGLPTFAKNNQKVWDVLNKAVSQIVITNDPVDQILKAAQQEAMSLVK